MGLALKVIGAGTMATSEGSLLLNAVGSGKAMLVKCMRFTNTSGSAVTSTVKFNRTTPSKVAAAFKQSINANSSVVDAGEIVLENGDSLTGLASAGTAVDYVISGIERDL